MKLNLKHLVISAAVSTFFMVITPLCVLAQESELVSRPYVEKSSSNAENSDENFDGSADEDEALKNGYFVKDSIISSSAASSRSNQASHRNQRSKNSNETAKQSENQKQADKNDEKDSILSFNFIYYIFKKFKWSDIVD